MKCEKKRKKEERKMWD